MRTFIINATIIESGKKLTGYTILIEDNLVKELQPISPEFSPEDQIIDARSNWVVPGLIDIHVHGGLGKDTMDGQTESLLTMSQYFASKGVTSFLPTTVAASNRDIKSAIARVSSFEKPINGARVLGIHLEGPYLNIKYKGAQPQQHIRYARPDEYLPWIETGIVKMVTVAPEIVGVLDLIETGRRFDVRFAVGHSCASYKQMAAAIERGLTQATHIFNGMPSLHHRSPGIVGSVLTDDRVFAQVIADGVHLHPVIVKLVLQLKTTHRSVLITDAISATGMKDGQYQLGDQIVEVNENIARTSCGSLAGSTLAMDTALRNTIKFTACPFEEIIKSATITAAESLGMDDEIGKIAPGYKADIVIMDDNLQPQLTMVDGKVVFMTN